MSDALTRLQQALAGRYAVERELGAGGMATVYLADDLRHRRRVAIKVLLSELSAEVGATRFLREIEIVAGLHHPHILPLYDSGEADGLLYYVMPLAEGESLRARLAREVQLPLDEAVRIAREVADALSYAHSRGIVHRDVKPENILLDGGHAVVTDFGIARVIGDEGATAGPNGVRLTATGVTVGTPLYMSPEQLSGNRVIDARSDVYSLACVLYEMLVGDPPHAGATAQVITARRLTEPPYGLRTTRSAVSPELERVILKALATTPADRWPTAAQFSEALERGAAALAHARSPRRWRRPALLGAVGLALIAGVLLVARALHARRPGAGAPPRLAVLPFDNLGPPEEAYFADGMSDEVRAHLGEIPGLAVIGRSSSMPYRGVSRPPQELGRELGVAWLLTGTVRRERRPDGTSFLEVSPELIRIRDGATAWGHPIAAALTDVFQVQAGIAADVAQALDVVLTTEQHQHLARQPTQNLAAYDAFLRGEERSERLGNVDPVSMGDAVRYYEQAVRLDTTFALAWARLGTALALHWTYDADDDTERGRSRDATLKATALAPDLPAAHVAAGMYLTLIAKDYLAAMREYDIARRLVPGGRDADLLSAIGLTEEFNAQWADAARDLREAQSVDPRSLPTSIRLSRALLWLRRYDEAVRVIDSGLAVAPTNLVLLGHKIMARVCGGNLAGARAVVAEAPATLDRDKAVAFLATYSVNALYWVLDDADQQRLLTVTPAQFQDDTLTWALIRSLLLQLRGDPAGARAYGDTVRRHLEVHTGGRPVDATGLFYHAQALAQMGRLAEARREMTRWQALRFGPADALNRDNAEFFLARFDAMTGATAQSLDRLDGLLRRPFWVSGAWLREDPAFVGLHGDARFRHLVEAGGE